MTLATTANEVMIPSSPPNTAALRCSLPDPLRARGEISTEGAGVHDEKPGGNDRIGLAKNEGKATELAIGIGRDLPSGDCGGAAEVFFWSEKGFGGAQALERAVVGNFGKRESFGFG